MHCITNVFNKLYQLTFMITVMFQTKQICDRLNATAETTLSCVLCELISVYFVLLRCACLVVHRNRAGGSRLKQVG